MSPEPKTAAPHRALIVLVGGFVLVLIARGFLVQSYYIPSGSMEPTLELGDRLLVNKVGVASALRRGDLVVFDGTHAFANNTDYVKRVVGLPGDHVVCCDAARLLTVNGTAIKEPYLYPGDQSSELTFDVLVPSERIWVMGDHRSDSADSRAHLGDPGGGMVRLDDVIGRVAVIYWPPSRAGVPDVADSLGKIPVTSAAERHK